MGQKGIDVVEHMFYNGFTYTIERSSAYGKCEYFRERDEKTERW